MVKAFIKRFIVRRHFWRSIGFNELSEIYAIQMLRTLAVSIVGIFTPVYLFKSGYSIPEILLGFVTVLFVARTIADIASAYMVARIGPKHSLALSVCVQITSLAMLVTLQTLNWPLWLVALVTGAGNSLYYVAFHVDFSKIKHTEHAGKEIGSMWIFDRSGAILGPLIGGLLANFFDPRYAIFASIGVLLVSLYPLFASAETVRLRQKISFRGLPWRRQAPNYVAMSAFELDNVASLIMWPLFLGVAIFTTDTYAKLGLIAALSTSIALSASWVIGRLVDRRSGPSLYQYSVLANAALHVGRSFVGSFGGVVALNIANDPVTVAFRMPFTKGYYDEADSIEGYRIAYISSMQAVGSAAKALYAVVLGVAMFYGDDIRILHAQFILVGALTLYMLSQRFRALS